MASETKIAWTDHTLNAWLGCTKVSDGCRHCYAETLTTNRMGLRVWGPDAPRIPTVAPWKHLREWNALAKREPGRLGPGQPHLVFTGSLMDWAEDREELNALRARLFAEIKRCDRLVFQLLTKRPENIGRCLPNDWADGYENVWLGTTIEDNRVKERADHLRAVAAKARFISYEPAIGPIDQVDFAGIDWVICGGESGPGYRALDHAWARDVRDRCVQAGIAFFMKQDAAPRTETRTYLLEQDGSRWLWKQYPGQLNPPIPLDV